MTKCCSKGIQLIFSGKSGTWTVKIYICESKDSHVNFSQGRSDENEIRTVKLNPFLKYCEILRAHLIIRSPWPRNQLQGPLKFAGGESWSQWAPCLLAGVDTKPGWPASGEFTACKSALCMPAFPLGQLGVWREGEKPWLPSLSCRLIQRVKRGSWCNYITSVWHHHARGPWPLLKHSQIPLPGRRGNLEILII